MCASIENHVDVTFLKMCEELCEIGLMVNFCCRDEFVWGRQKSNKQHFQYYVLPRRCSGVQQLHRKEVGQFPMHIHHNVGMYIRYSLTTHVYIPSNIGKSPARGFCKVQFSRMCVVILHRGHWPCYY